MTNHEIVLENEATMPTRFTRGAISEELKGLCKYLEAAYMNIPDPFSGIIKAELPLYHCSYHKGSECIGGTYVFDSNEAMKCPLSIYLRCRGKR